MAPDQTASHQRPRNCFTACQPSRASTDNKPTCQKPSIRSQLIDEGPSTLRPICFRVTKLWHTSSHLQTTGPCSDRLRIFWSPSPPGELPLTDIAHNIVEGALTPHDSLSPCSTSRTSSRRPSNCWILCRVSICPTPTETLPKPPSSRTNSDYPLPSIPCTRSTPSLRFHPPISPKAGRTMQDTTMPESYISLKPTCASQPPPPVSHRRPAPRHQWCIQDKHTVVVPVAMASPSL